MIIAHIERALCQKGVSFQMRSIGSGHSFNTERTILLKYHLARYRSKNNFVGLST